MVSYMLVEGSLLVVVSDNSEGDIKSDESSGLDIACLTYYYY